MTALFLQELETLFFWLLTASWQASVLAVFVLLIQRMLGARLNPRWRYALWLLVLVRLIMPAVPESAFSLDQFTPRPSPMVFAPITEPLFVSAPPGSSPVVATAIEKPEHPFTLYSLLAVTWLTGAIGLLNLTWIVNRRFALQVANSPAISDAELLRLFAEVKAELGIRREIRLIENSKLQSPAIMGLFHPTLLLPADVRAKFDATELRLIFLHELAHLKRGDVIVQALIALLQILHWFNPVLWFAFRRMRIDREPATDALVLSRTGESEKERYGLMLIKLLEHFNQRHSLPTLVGILEDKDQFKRRFSLIAKFTHGAYGWSLLGVVIIAILSVGCLTKSKTAHGDLAESKQTPKPDAKALIVPPIQGTNAASEKNTPDLRVEYVVLSIPEADYEAHRAEIDAAAAKGDYATAQTLGHFTVLGQTSLGQQFGKLAVLALGSTSNPTIPLTQLRDTATASGDAFTVTGQLTANDIDGDEMAPDGSGRRPKLATRQANINAQMKPGQPVMIELPGTDKLPRIFSFMTAAVEPSPVIDKSGVLPLPAGKADASNPPMAFTIAWVEVDEKTYQQEAQAMDEAVRTGNLSFFDQRQDGVGVIRTNYMYLLVGQPGWYSEGQVQAYVDSVVEQKKKGVPMTTLSAKATFIGLNADFMWSPDKQHLDSKWHVTMPKAMEKPAPGVPFGKQEFKETTYSDKGWDMTPGKAHGFWVGQIDGSLKMLLNGHGKPGESPTRLAVFMTAKPYQQPTPGPEPKNAGAETSATKAMPTTGTLAEMALALEAGAKAIPPDHHRLQILQGFYGADGSWRDVTDVLQKSIKNDALKVAWEQPYTEIGGDPAYLKVKTLIVSYRINGIDKQATFQEQNYPVGLQASIPTGSEALAEKLKSIVIDKLYFKKVDIATVIQFLSVKSKELDPDHTGVNFFLRLGPAPDAAHQTEAVRREVTLAMTNVTLLDILADIDEQTKLKYSLQDDGIYLRPAFEEYITLTVRTFLVPHGFFPEAKPNTPDVTSIDMQLQLTDKGIRFPAGATASFLPGLGKLVVRNTPDQLDLIAKLIEEVGMGVDPRFSVAGTYTTKGDGMMSSVVYLVGKPIKGNPELWAMEERRFAKDLSFWKSLLKLTPEQEAAVKETLAAVMQSYRDDKPVVKTLHQTMEEILTPEQAKLWRDLNDNSPEAMANTLTISEVGAAAKELHLTDAQKEKMFSALRPIETDAQKKIRTLVSPSEISSQLEDVAHAKEMAMVNILSAEQFGTYMEQVQKGVQLSKAGLQLSDEPPPPLQFNRWPPQPVKMNYGN